MSRPDLKPKRPRKVIGASWSRTETVKTPLLAQSWQVRFCLLRLTAICGGLAVTCTRAFAIWPLSLPSWEVLTMYIPHGIL